MFHILGRKDIPLDFSFLLLPRIKGLIEIGYYELERNFTSCD
jgi:hypothetical protein